MVLYLWGFTTLIFAIAYLFQMMGMTLIGLELIAILLLFLCFWESRKGRILRIIGMDIIMVLFVAVLYSSQHTFTYIQQRDSAKLCVIIVGFIIAQFLGMFWGKQFYKHELKNKKD